MFKPKYSELRVFISGVSKEFGSDKGALRDMLKTNYGIFAYCNEVDKLPGFEYIWPKLKSEIITSQIFVLFLGSCYGTQMPAEDMSVTQKEYETAKKLKKPIIVFRLEKDSKEFDEHQEEFYNQVINIDKDERWAPPMENDDIHDAKKLSGHIMQYIYSNAAEAIPSLNNVDEAGNFYLELRIHGKPHIEGVNGDIVVLKMDIVIQNKDEYSHLITDVGLEMYGEKHHIRDYKEDYRSGFVLFNNSPIKILGKDKKLITANFNLNIPDGRDSGLLESFLEDFETLKKDADPKTFLPLKFKQFLPIDFNSI